MAKLGKNKNANLLSDVASDPLATTRLLNFIKNVYIDNPPKNEADMYRELDSFFEQNKTDGAFTSDVDDSELRSKLIYDVITAIKNHKKNYLTPHILFGIGLIIVGTLLIALTLLALIPPVNFIILGAGMLFVSPWALGLGLSEGKDMVSTTADVDSIHYSTSHITGSKESDDKLCGMLVKYSSRVIPKSRSGLHLGKDGESQEKSLPVAHALNNIPIVAATPIKEPFKERSDQSEKPSPSAPPHSEMNHNTKRKK